MQETSNLLGSLASEGVVPQILLDIENVQPEGVSMESIKHGASVPRNKLLFNHGINLLPSTGAGSGITRALKFTPDIKFVNDDTLNEFIVTVERRDVGETDIKNNRVSDRDRKDREDIDKALKNNDLENIRSSKTDREDRDDLIEMHQVSYKSLSGVQKNVIQFCSVPVRKK